MKILVVVIMVFFFFRLAQHSGFAFSYICSACGGCLHARVDAFATPHVCIVFYFKEEELEKATWGAWNIMQHITRDVIHFLQDGRALSLVVYRSICPRGGGHRLPKEASARYPMSATAPRISSRLLPFHVFVFFSGGRRSGDPRIQARQV